MKPPAKQAADVDARRAEQRHRGGPKGVAPHDAALADALRAGHGDELLLQRGDEVAAQHAVVDDEAADGQGEGGQRQALEVGDPVRAQRDVGRHAGMGYAELDRRRARARR